MRLPHDPRVRTKYQEVAEPDPFFRFTRWRPASDVKARKIRNGWRGSFAVLGIRSEERVREILNHGRPLMLVALFREGEEALSRPAARARGRVFTAKMTAVLKI